MGPSQWTVWDIKQQTGETYCSRFKMCSPNINQESGLARLASSMRHVVPKRRVNKTNSIIVMDFDQSTTDNWLCFFQILNEVFPSVTLPGCIARAKCNSDTWMAILLRSSVKILSSLSPAVSHMICWVCLGFCSKDLNPFDHIDMENSISTYLWGKRFAIQVPDHQGGPKKHSMRPINLGWYNFALVVVLMRSRNLFGVILSQVGGTAQCLCHCMFRLDSIVWTCWTGEVCRY